MQSSRIRQIAPWFLLTLWFLGLTLLLYSLIRSGTLPVDYATYQKAADALHQGASPYTPVAASQQIWSTYHILETRLLAGEQVPTTGPVLSGPYLYPPSLALLIRDLHLNAFSFVGLLWLSVCGFGALWLYSTGQNAWWLLLIIGSWDVVASFTGGNVELFLLFATLLAAWLWWRQQSLLLTPLVALVVLIKPFYALFFVAFGLLLVAQAGSTPKQHQLRHLLRVGIGTVLLITLEVARWPAWLRWETFTYLRNAFAYQWLVLPIAQQTPMSIWNRTPLQGLVNAGMVPQLAQWVALGLWLLLMLITLWRVRQRRLTFPLTFALAFVLLYWGRPVGWGLIYLELVVLSASWPLLMRQPRRLLVVAMLALTASHWLALALTVQGRWLRLFTLQSANFPWETWLVVPLCWIVLLAVLPLRNLGDGPSSEMPSKANLAYQTKDLGSQTPR